MYVVQSAYKYTYVHLWFPYGRLRTTYPSNEKKTRAFIRTRAFTVEFCEHHALAIASQARAAR